MKNLLVLSCFAIGGVFLTGHVFAQDDYISQGDAAYEKFDNHAALGV